MELVELGGNLTGFLLFNLTRYGPLEERRKSAGARLLPLSLAKRLTPQWRKADSNPRCRGLDQKGKPLELSFRPRTEERLTPFTRLCAASD